MGVVSLNRIHFFIYEEAEDDYANEVSAINTLLKIIGSKYELIQSIEDDFMPSSLDQLNKIFSMIKETNVNIANKCDELQTRSNNLDQWDHLKPGNCRKFLFMIRTVVIKRYS